MRERLNPFFYASNSELLAYEKAWVAYIKNGEPPLENIISAEIFNSWERCRDNNMNPLDRDVNEPLNSRELQNRRNDNRYVLEVAGKYMDIMYNVVEDTDIAVDFIDADGYVLKSLRSHALDTLVEITHTGLGFNMSESVAGTNAIAMAIINKKATQTSGAQFFMQKYHTLTISAAPILGFSGDVLGVLAISSNYETVHKHTLGMVIAATNAVQNEMRIDNINRELKYNIAQRAELMNMVTDGIMYTVDDYVMHINSEMCNIIGRKESECKGQKLGTLLKTKPEIETLFDDSDKGYSKREILVKGKNAEIKCFYKVSMAVEGGQTTKLLLLTKVDEIKRLAGRITSTNDNSFENIISVSGIMREKIEMARRAAKYDSRILIQGESGTGKDLLAQAIHNESSRGSNAFIAINCGTIPRELFESEMFGYVGGAFTGARKEGKTGLFEMADNGSLFLDEIGNMPMEMQVKLLRVIQEGTIIKVGETKQRQVDVRIIAATNANLEEEVRAGKFREDLYYRLNVIEIEIPPLRERREDIPVLVNHFLAKYRNVNDDRKQMSITSEAMQALTQYNWPGNIRQLQNVIERVLIFARDNTIEIADIPYEIKAGSKSHVIESRTRKLNDVIRNHIKTVIAEENGNISKAAEALGITRATIYNKLKG